MCLWPSKESHLDDFLLLDFDFDVAKQEDHITPGLISSHQLPVHQIIDLKKTLLLVYKALKGFGPRHFFWSAALLSSIQTC